MGRTCSRCSECFDMMALSFSDADLAPGGRATKDAGQPKMSTSLLVKTALVHLPACHVSHLGVRGQYHTFNGRILAAKTLAYGPFSISRSAS